MVDVEETILELFSLVYVSLATHEMSEDELCEILRVSRINNTKNNITGMLLYQHKYFIQVLEGTASNVKGTYRKIKSDPRHKHLIIAHQELIAEREFDRWAMRFNHLDNLDSSDLPAFSDFLNNSVYETFFNDQSHVMLLLRMFRDKISY